MAEQSSPNIEFPYFLKGEIVPFDEDVDHEFKGHRNLCVEEIPPSCLKPRPLPTGVEQNVDSANSHKRPICSGQSRQAVSKTLNGFLNTGQGGKVYLGITDDGVVRGIQLTEHQSDHVEKSLTDLMQRFKPAVPKNFYKMRFVPVVEKDDDMFGKRDHQKENKKSHETEEHVLRTYEKCWCDIDAQARLAHGNIPALFVIEITIFKWQRPPIDFDSLINNFHKYLHPIYETELGECYFRRQASVKMYTKQQIYIMSIQETRDFCTEILKKLKQKKRDLEFENRQNGT